MGLINRFMNGLYAGSSAFWRTFSDPSGAARDLSRDQRLNVYQQGWSYYRNTAFSTRDVSSDYWKTYLSDRELYKHTRLIFNVVPPIVDFYVDNIWQASKNGNFESLATPLSDKTDENITAAVAQLDQWSNWLSEANKIKRYAAATGNVLIEGIDDLEREKITHKTQWAGYVTDFELDDSGNLTSYTLEYDVSENKKTYRFKKIVTKESFQYFKDDAPFAYPGKEAEMENPYGFCFAVWLRHTDDGSVYGLPACNSLDKVDEVNSLASHLHDNIHKEIESGKLIGLDDPKSITVLTGGTNNKDGTLAMNDPRLERVLLAAKGQVTVNDLSGLLKLAEAEPYLKNLISSFYDDYPEIDYRRIIKESGAMSGVALERLLTPAQNRLNGVQANYNQQLVKLRQMQLAVAGMRQNGGGWTMRTKQQKLFSEFDLKSYKKGDLDFNLKPSVLVQINEGEQEDILKKKADRAVSLKDVVDEREQLAIAGYTDEQAQEILGRMEVEKAQKQKDAEAAAMNALNGGLPPKQIGDGLPTD
jgi:hypothetical protein